MNENLCPQMTARFRRGGVSRSSEFSGYLEVRSIPVHLSENLLTRQIYPMIRSASIHRPPLNHIYFFLFHGLSVECAVASEDLKEGELDLQSQILESFQAVAHRRGFLKLQFFRGFLHRLFHFRNGRRLDLFHRDEELTGKVLDLIFD